jgi:hypothetical protein
MAEFLDTAVLTYRHLSFSNIVPPQLNSAPTKRLSNYVSSIIVITDTVQVVRMFCCAGEGQHVLLMQVNGVMVIRSRAK